MVVLMEHKILVVDGEEEIVVREANEGDATGILDYLDRVSRESQFLTFEAGTIDITLEDEKKMLRSVSESLFQTFIIAVSGEQVVGAMSFFAKDRNRIKHYGEIGISVSKRLWGKGVGSLMLDFLTEWAKGTNVIRKINLSVRVDNDRAIALYDKKGFKKEGRITRAMRIDDKFYDNYVMGLELDY